MPNPVTARAFDQTLDPDDVVDFYVFVSQGNEDASPPTMLLLGEGVADYRLALTAEAIAVGLAIVDTDGKRNSLSGNMVTLYLEVIEAMRGASIFNGAGVTVAIELTILTTEGRTKQRSFLVRIANQ